MSEVAIDDSQQEMCAVLVMRTMLTDYWYTVNHPYCSNFKPPFPAAGF